MKKIITVILAFCIVAFLTSCHNENNPKQGQAGQETEAVQADDGQTGDVKTEGSDAKALVVYFSCTGHTKTIAGYIAEATGADVFEVVPKEPYNSEDLNYNDKSSRSSKEMNDSAARPEISDNVENFRQYEKIYLGYPIWWGEAPRILSTFVESYDFSGKTVIPFCTSGSSGVGSSAKNLEELAGGGNWLEGKRFSSSEDADKVSEWLNNL